MGRGSMRSWPLPLQPRFIVFTTVVLFTASLSGAFFFSPSIYVALPLALCAALTALGTVDLMQTRHAVLRNYPLTAHIRFILEEIRPEIRQYFLESEKDGTPFSRDKRAIVYQRAKRALDKRPFGTQNDVYASGFEWLNHSITPRPVVKEPFRVVIGGPGCSKLYSGSVFNIPAMSFGALSPNAIRALNIGAKRGNFAHDTGEGGYSAYHRENGGDIIWEIGSGYFSCRNPDGAFCAEKFKDNASCQQVKMVELKLSQGAKPGHGGVLPAAKVSMEIAAARGVPMGARLHFASATFGFLEPDRDDAFHRQHEEPFRWQADWLQALCRPSVGIPRHLQGDARDGDLSGLHRRRWHGRRHRRGSAWIYRSRRDVIARGTQFRSQRADRN